MLSLSLHLETAEQFAGAGSNSYQRGRRHLLTRATSAPGTFEPKETAAARSDGPQ
jgi:hypothetical protein